MREKKMGPLQAHARPRARSLPPVLSVQLAVGAVQALDAAGLPRLQQLGAWRRRAWVS